MAKYVFLFKINDSLCTFFFLLKRFQHNSYLKQRQFLYNYQLMENYFWMYWKLGRGVGESRLAQRLPAYLQVLRLGCCQVSRNPSRVSSTHQAIVSLAGLPGWLDKNAFSHQGTTVQDESNQQGPPLGHADHLLPPPVPLILSLPPAGLHHLD